MLIILRKISTTREYWINAPIHIYYFVYALFQNPVVGISFIDPAAGIPSSIQAQVSQQAPVAPDIDKVVEKKKFHTL